MRDGTGSGDRIREEIKVREIRKVKECTREEKKQREFLRDDNEENKYGEGQRGKRKSITKRSNETKTKRMMQRMCKRENNKRDKQELSK